MIITKSIFIDRNIYKALILIQNDYIMITKGKIETLNVRIPTQIVIWLDSLVDSGMYKSRAEALRFFVRDYVKKTEE